MQLQLATYIGHSSSCSIVLVHASTGSEVVDLETTGLDPLYPVRESEGSLGKSRINFGLAVRQFNNVLLAGTWCTVIGLHCS